ncbi:MAG: hypothetical protein LBI04_09165 [Treponema sp.]|jgi:hypothetical protein|nr:hypothetical protein [Treponema sp.]
MKETFKFSVAGIGIMLVMCAVFGAALMVLWNALMPQIFGLGQISYLQAAGLLLLARILFGGLAGWKGNSARQAAGGGGHLFHQNNKLREKWMSMNEEERKEFIEKEKDFFKFNRRFSHLHQFFEDDEKKEQGE